MTKYPELVLAGFFKIDFDGVKMLRQRLTKEFKNLSRCKDFALVSPMEFGTASSVDTPWVVAIVGAPETL